MPNYSLSVVFFTKFKLLFILATRGSITSDVKSPYNDGLRFTNCFTITLTISSLLSP